MSGRFAGLLLGSFTAPRATARALIDRPFTSGDITSATAVLAIVVTFINLAFARLGAGEADPVQRFIIERPLLMALIQFASIPIGAAINLGIARLFGGRGSFRDTMIGVIWLNAMVALVQAGFLVLHRVLVPVQDLFLILALIWWLYAYAAALCEIHGFRSIFAVLGAMIAIGLLFILLTVWFATSFGLIAPVGA